MECCGFSFTSASDLSLRSQNPGPITVGGLVDVRASVHNCNEAGSCYLSGSVNFAWVGLSTGMPGSPFDHNPALIWGGFAPFVAPGQTGLAEYTWDPPPALAGCIGTVMATVATDNVAGPPCCGTQSVSTTVLVSPQGGQQVEALKAESTFVGFGVIGQNFRTRVFARALTHPKSQLVVPDIAIAISRAIGNPLHRYHSGVAIPEKHLEPAPKFERHIERWLDWDEVQGCLRIRWPPGPETDACLIEVCQEITEGPRAGKRIGEFIVGIPKSPRRSLWC